MTPTASRLKARLDERRNWFINQWFFKWHFIGKDEPVTIDSFDGRGIHYGGIKFDGTARMVYWDAIVRGVRKEITEQFAWVDREVRNYNRETSLQAIDECAGLLSTFVRSIRREAVAKDRILRGDGINFPPDNDAGRWEGTSDREIAAEAEGLKAAIPALSGNHPAFVAPDRQWSWWARNKFWLEPVGWVIGAGSVASSALVFLIG